MKTILTAIAASSLLAALAIAQPTPRYKVTDLGPQGADPAGGPYVLRNSGLISGGAPVSLFPDTVHAVYWYKGRGPFDIATPGLGGPNSIAFGVNDSGQFAGQAETSDSDPEDFCGFKAAGLSPGKVCLPFVWQNGVMRPLPTLGGKNGYATTINNPGEAAGLAETNSSDQNPDCPIKQFRPVIWQNGNIHERLTSGFDSRGLAFNDPDGFVYGINDKGQVVGASGVCSPVITNNGTYLQALHALLWEKDGTVHDLGNLGGTGHGTGTWAITINSQGQVVGASDKEGDQRSHAFLWTKETGMQDLGTLPGDDNSGGIWINDGGDVVGVSHSFATGFHRAFLLPKGATEMIDLNDRIPDGSPFHLMFGVGIDSRGEIMALAFDSDDNQVHGVLLTPIHGAAAGESFSPAARGATSPVVLPDNVRKLLGGRFGVRGR